MQFATIEIGINILFATLTMACALLNLPDMLFPTTYKRIPDPTFFMSLKQGSKKQIC